MTPTNPPSEPEETDGDLDVAVIGMAGRFPGARDVEQFWSNIAGGVESITFLDDRELAEAGVPPSVHNAQGYVRATSRLDDVDAFDAALFGYSPKEAALMDPQSRVALELAWHALEDAGCNPFDFTGSIGVFACASLSTYLLSHLSDRLDPQDFILGLGNLPVILGNGPDFVATRISYKLNLRGPSVVVQTACSSSLTAIHQARQSLLSGECDMAVAGGVSIYLPQNRGYLFQDGMILSSDGHARAFDADADGIRFGRGGGMIVLKPLARAIESGDRIRAVVKGSAVNNDGSRKVGFTAPSQVGQARVIAEALADAGKRADDISYIEAHGTGTRVGDPIEIAGLTEAFRKHTDRVGYCAIGTVKTNIGHLDVAAGVTGVIKTVLMLEHRQIAPILNFKRPNPAIDFRSSPFYVNTELKPWDAPGPLSAGVSSFGIGGTNVHVILEEAPPPRASAVPTRAFRILRVTGRTEEAVATLSAELAERVARTDATELADVCYTANTGRAHLAHRIVVRAASPEAMRDVLGSAAAGRSDPRIVRGPSPVSGAPPLAFLFPGLGAQTPGMGKALFDTEPVFREALERCDALLRPHLPLPLLRVIYPGPGEATPIDQTAYGQPVMFAFEYALATLWQSWGVRPSVVLGHSLGEYAASCVSGVLTLEDALRLVALRSRLVGALPTAGMAAVFASEATVAEAILGVPGYVTIASVNSPESIVLSGDVAALEYVIKALESRDIEARMLNVTHGFHSALLDPILDEFEAGVALSKFGRPRIPVISNVTGGVRDEAEGRNPQYWRRHARQVVRFADGVQTLIAQGIRHFLEVGPHTTATGMAAGCVTDDSAVFLPSLRRGRDDCDQILEAVSELYVRGIDVDWAGVDGKGRSRVSVPLYPFARTRHWIDEVATRAPLAAATDATRPMLRRAVRSPLITDRVFELVVDTRVHAFLGDHVIFDTPIFPATGYVESVVEAVEAATGRHGTVVEELEITQALDTGPDGRREAQLVLKPERDGFRFEFHAADEQGDGWTRCASGRATHSGNGVSHPGRLDVAALRARLPEARSGKEFYAELAERGFAYGPLFRGIESLRVGQGEIAGEVRLPEALAERTAGFCFHPALLDACLQMVLAAVPAGKTFLPTRIGRVTLGKWQPNLVAHATRRPSASGARTMSWDVRVANEQGEVVAELADIVLQETDARSVGRARTPVWGQWLYGVAWRPAPLPSHEGVAATLPSPAHLGGVMDDRLEAVRDRHGLAEYDAVQRELDDACIAYVSDAVRELGWNPAAGEAVTVAELCKKLSIRESQRRMARRLLDMLAEDGQLSREGETFRANAALSKPRARNLDDLRARHPRFTKMFEITDRCGAALARGLRGEVKAVDLLFPGGSLADMEGLYHTSPFALAYNELVASAVADVVRTLPDGAPLRVLEVGAGTGGTTGSVLPVLPVDRTRYTYTDTSRLFLARAEERFAAFPFITYRLLDAEGDPLAQGFAGEAFDLVIASNVLHATASLEQTMTHMHRLLASGGLLLLVEGIARQRWVDLVFGLTEGWWKFTDTDRRADYPLVSAAEWRAVLSQTGFEDFVCVPDEAHASLLFNQAILLARRPIHAAKHVAAGKASSPGRRRWLVVGDDPICRAVLERIASAGDAATSAPSADSPAWAEALSANGDAVDAVVLVAPLGATLAEGATGTRALLTIVQAMTSHAATSSARLWVVTRGARAVASGDTVPGVFAASLWGLAQTVQLEHPELRCACIDLDPEDPTGTDALWSELSASTPETQIAFREKTRHVARLERVAPTQPVSADVVRRLESSSPGELDGLRYVEVPRRAPAPGEVEIRVRAAGLNFKDVLTALGRFPVPAQGLGFECAGEIAAVGASVPGFTVGDRVVALALGSLATHVTVNAHLVAPKPDSLSFEEAATIAGGFLTAYHALHTLARIERGDRVLVHAATGGVGLAAVQLARRAGAEVFATAGSDAKCDLLRSMGVAHVWSSRNTDFAPGIARATGGKGVSVVLNSLTGAVREQSFAVLAAGGRFVELGADEGSGHAGNGAKAEYHQPNVAEECMRNPAPFGAVLRELLGAIAQGELSALPHRDFDNSDTIGAFRLMARAGHIGKVVVRQADADSPTIGADATYLIAGGLGGLGILVAEHLVDRGARHVALMARRVPTAPEQTALDQLEARGADVFVLRGDVTRREDVAGAISIIRRDKPPLRGVIQATGVLDDGVIAQQTWDRFARVMAPKVEGTFHLEEETKALPLDFFVMFSSVASLLGSPGQGNHAAANAFMDELAAHRRARGLPAVSIGWGAWARVGAAADRQIGDRIATRGMGQISPEGGIEAFDHLLAGSRPYVGVVPMDWKVFGDRFPGGEAPPFVTDVLASSSTPEARAIAPEATPDFSERLRRATPGEQRTLVARFIRDQVGKGLGLPADQAIDGTLPLSALGLDSLLAVELRNALSRGLGLPRRLSATVLFDYPSIDALTGHLLEVLDLPKAAPLPPAPAPAPKERKRSVVDYDAIASLSDEEAEALLLQELEQT